MVDNEVEGVGNICLRGNINDLNNNTGLISVEMYRDIIKKGTKLLNKNSFYSFFLLSVTLVCIGSLAFFGGVLW